MAGGEFRFGTASIYMAEAESFGRPVQVTNALLHGYKFRRVEAVFPGIPPIYSNGKSEARISQAIRPILRFRGTVSIAILWRSPRECPSRSCPRIRFRGTRYARLHG